MRTIEAKKSEQTGERYHYCPKTNEQATKNTCADCPLGKVEELPASYRIHCNFGGEVVAFIPSHAEDSIPQSWGEDKFALTQYTVIEPKLDGARCIIVIDAEGGFHAYTRRTNRFGEQTEITDNLPHLKKINFKAIANSILDGEIFLTKAAGKASATGTESTGTLGQIMSVVGAAAETAIATQELLGYAEVYVFDLPKALAADLTDMIHSRRQDMLDRGIWHLIPEEALKFIHRMPTFTTSSAAERKARYEVWLEKGVVTNEGITVPVEGAVLKNPNAKYFDLRAMLKKKESVTLDILVTGFEFGKKGGKYEKTIGALLFSVTDKATGQLREIGKVVPGDDATRAQMFSLIGNLNPEQIKDKKVIIEVTFQNFTKQYRSRHPRIVRYRPDRGEPNVVDFETVDRK
jgi:ATP-dependent DNA ligase